MDITTAKQLSVLYVNVRTMVALINQGAELNAQCLAITNAVATDQNFTTVLSTDEQTWVNNSVEFFNSLAAQLPPIPATILSAIQS